MSGDPPLIVNLRKEEDPLDEDDSLELETRRVEELLDLRYTLGTIPLLNTDSKS